MNRFTGRGVLFFLLAISVLFNIFFVLGHMQMRSAGTPVLSTSLSDDDNGARTDDAVRLVSDTLALDAAQREVFASLHRSVMEDRMDVRRSQAMIRQQLLEALRDDDIDPDRIRDLVLRQLDSDRRHRAFAAQRFSEFLGALDHEQRSRIRKDVEGPSARGRSPRGEEGRPSRRNPQGGHRESPPRWILEQFDKDRDGQLNEEERAEAERFLEERRREREMRRADLMRRFDLDGDGRLNAEEREAMRRWLQEQRDGGQPSPEDSEPQGS